MLCSKECGLHCFGSFILVLFDADGFSIKWAGFFFKKKNFPGFWNNDYLFYLFFCDMIQLGPQLINLGWR